MTTPAAGWKRGPATCYLFGIARKARQQTLPSDVRLLEPRGAWRAFLGSDQMCKQ